jgi:uncharacterized protein involved in response to NO
MALWILRLRGVVALPTIFSPVVFPELLYGFVVAAIAGFFLTAIPKLDRPAATQGEAEVPEIRRITGGLTCPKVPATSVP